jgi:hypothetical protein
MKENMLVSLLSPKLHHTHHLLLMMKVLLIRVLVHILELVDPIHLQASIVVTAMRLLTILALYNTCQLEVILMIIMKAFTIKMHALMPVTLLNQAHLVQPTLATTILKANHLAMMFTHCLETMM